MPRKKLQRSDRPWPTAVDLFSGCGGLTLGLKRAQFRVIGAIEIDSLAAATYRLNHPGTRLWESDIREVSGDDICSALEIQARELDLLAGCPPCQGFSSMRTLNQPGAVEDERNDLVFEFVRLVRELLPKAIMLENVPGLARDNRIEQVVAELDELGYEAEFRVRNAAKFGVPQRRRRLILLAGSGDSIAFPVESTERLTVRQVIAGLDPAGSSGDTLHDFPESRSDRIQRLIARIPADGGSRSALGAKGQLACHTGFTGFHDVYGRMAWDDVSPTITSGCVNPSKGRFLHPEENRTITLREAALLQGFPADYKFSLDRGKYAVAAMIGNALPPEFVRRHAKEVRKSLVPA